MNLRLLFISLVFVFSATVTNAQNLLNTSTWTVGSGSVSGFGQNGSTSENNREYGIGPEGTNVLLWKATPDASNNADGGWNTSYANIDHTKPIALLYGLKKQTQIVGLLILVSMLIIVGH